MQTPCAVPPARPEEPNGACACCNLRQLCLAAGLAPADLQRLEAQFAARRTVQRSEYLFRSGDEFGALYVVRTGCFKTLMSTADGRDQITGFQLAGELLGLEGIGGGRHRCDAVALEDSQVCVVPFGQLQALAHAMPDLQRQLLERMSREIVRDHTMQLLLGSLHADERLAAFLLDLMQRLAERGCSPTSLRLRMTRQEIGDCLGLTLETVSRCFSRLQDEGVLKVRQRQIEVLDAAALRNRMRGVGC